MLVLLGHNSNAITSLAYLVHPKNVEDGLGFRLERSGNKPMRSAADVAILLAKISKHWVKAPAEHVEVIGRYAGNLKPRGEGTGGKNGRVRLFLLPGKISQGNRGEEEA
jgi:hypothetical protein